MDDPPASFTQGGFWGAGGRIATGGCTTLAMTEASMVPRSFDSLRSLRMTGQMENFLKIGLSTEKMAILPLEVLEI